LRVGQNLLPDNRHRRAHTNLGRRYRALKSN
jgi:hypothetical protein